MVVTNLFVTCLGIKLLMCLITNHTMGECGTVEILCYTLLISLQSALWRNRDCGGITLFSHLHLPLLGLLVTEVDHMVL